MIKKGFTLIEVLVVVSVISLVLPAVFTIVFLILRQQAKVYVLQEVKRQGDFVLNNMRTTIKNNAVTVHSGVPTSANQVCNSVGSSSVAGTTLYFKDSLNNYFWYTSDGTKIASNSSIPSTTTDLTGSKVNIPAGTPLTISCFRGGSFSAPIISVSYGISYNTTSLRTEDNASFDYKTKIQLRNF